MSHFQNILYVNFRCRKETSDINDADTGIKWFETVLQHVPNDPHAQTGLAALLQLRADDLILSNVERRAISDRALLLLKNVIATTLDADPALPSRLGKCSSVLADRFEFDGQREHIDEAIAHQERAISLPQVVSSSLWFHYAQLSHYLQQRFFHTRNSLDLESAREAATKALHHAGTNPECRARALQELACSQATSYQFHVTHDLAELDSAINDLREAMKIRPDWRSVPALRNLGSALMLRFERDGSYEDASEGIACVREAVDILRKLVGKGNHQSEISAIRTLAKAHGQRAARYRGQEDLDEAVRLYRGAYLMTDEEHARRIDIACDFAFALADRYNISVRKNMSDLEDAKRITEETLGLIRSRATLGEILRLQNTLGMIHTRQYAVNESSETINIAIAWYQACVNAIPLLKMDSGKETTEFGLDELTRAYEPHSTAVPLPHGDSAKEMMEVAAGNLAQALRLKATTTKIEKDFVVAMAQYQRLIQGYKNSNTQIPSYLIEGLADVALALRRSKEHSREGIARLSGLVARQSYCELLDRRDVSLETKVLAAIEASQLFYLIDEDISKACELAKTAVQRLSEAITLGLSRFDHLRMVRKFSHLPNTALCYSILAGESSFE